MGAGLDRKQRTQSDFFSQGEDAFAALCEHLGKSCERIGYDGETCERTEVDLKAPDFETLTALVEVQVIRSASTFNVKADKFLLVDLFYEGQPKPVVWVVFDEKRCRYAKIRHADLYETIQRLRLAPVAVFKGNAADEHKLAFKVPLDELNWQPTPERVQRVLTGQDVYRSVDDEWYDCLYGA